MNGGRMQIIRTDEEIQQLLDWASKLAMQEYMRGFRDAIMETILWLQCENAPNPMEVK
jgi:hypothetical protein